MSPLRCYFCFVCFFHLIVDYSGFAIHHQSSEEKTTPLFVTSCHISLLPEICLPNPFYLQIQEVQEWGYIVISYACMLFPFSYILQEDTTSSQKCVEVDTRFTMGVCSVPLRTCGNCKSITSLSLLYCMSFCIVIPVVSLFIGWSCVLHTSHHKMGIAPLWDIYPSSGYLWSVGQLFNRSVQRDKVSPEKGQI